MGPRECTLGSVGVSAGGVDGISGMSGVFDDWLVRSVAPPGADSLSSRGVSVGHAGHGGAIGVPMRACDWASVECDWSEEDASGLGADELCEPSTLASTTTAITAATARTSRFRCLVNHPYVLHAQIPCYERLFAKQQRTCKQMPGAVRTAACTHPPTHLPRPRRFSSSAASSKD
jgi:hypothetical protein